MPLVEPTIDDRSYQQILNEALARIPVHNPEWTNFNDSDPGVTLVQLFAFMTESLLYRANLIPERNRIKFLQLLGIPMQPATSAQGLITFSNTRGPLETKTLDSGLEVFAGQVPFRTEDGLDVLPIEAQVYYKASPDLEDEELTETETLYQQLYASLDKPGVRLEIYETKQLKAPAAGAEFPTVNLSEDTVGDRALWVALLARSADLIEQTRQAIANKVLNLGILPALSDAARVLLPGGPSTPVDESALIFEIPKALQISGTEVSATYQTLDAQPSGNLLFEPGVVALTLPGVEQLSLWENLDPQERGVGNLPPSLEDTATAERVITWIRIRRRVADNGVDSPSQLGAQLSWVGINAARITQRASVFAEFLGQGTGEPDQAVTLVNTPVIPESVRLTVNGELWQQIDDLAAASPEVPKRSPGLTPGVISTSTAAENSKVYALDRESGEVRFGDGLRGKRPPRGAIIQASYDYGGGLAGVVGIGAVNKGPLLPAGIKASNPIPTWGGDEPETVDEAERRIPGYLRHQDRMVAATDFEEIVKRTPGIDLGRVEVLPLYHPTVEDFPAEGVVTLMVIPKYDPVQPDAPQPDRLFLDTVCNYVNPRRLITTEVHVRGPEYAPVWVSVGIDVVSGYDIAPVREAVKEEIRTYLSPLTGGRDETGWPLERAVERLELWAVATRVDGVSKVNEVLLCGESGTEVDRISITGLDLPQLVGISVQSGDPQPLADLRGDAVDGDGDGDGVQPQVVPIPVVPTQC